MDNQQQNSEEDMAVFVESLLKDMQDRFQTMSSTIIGRIDEISGRIDNLEKSVGDLMTQAGIEEDADKKAAESTQN